MNTKNIITHQTRHLKVTSPTPWIARFVPIIAKNAQVLDVACGGGRHSRLLLDQSHHVTAIDLHTEAITERLAEHDRLSIVTADLEDGRDVFGSEGALRCRQFDAIVVVNYLHRALFDGLLDALKPGGILLYETFALGNERYDRPRNPDHLLKPGELLKLVEDRLQVVAYECGLVEDCELPGVKQRIAAVKSSEPCEL